MADFEEHLGAFNELGATVYALSVDNRENAEKSVERHGLEFPVGFGLDGKAVAEATGAYRDEEGGHLQATSFILRDGRVMHASYSSGPLGRLQAEHAVGFIRYVEMGG